MKNSKFLINTPIISKRFLFSVPIIFIIVATLKIAYSYDLMKEAERTIIFDESKVLSDFMMTHRSYYQNLYINKDIVLNKKTLPGLPAFSAYDISREFSHRNIQKIVLQTVSDRARNSKNMADRVEMKAIDAFRNDKTLNEYFEYIEDVDQNYYQYAIPLHIKKTCLECHGSKDSAPQFIQEIYDMAYDYKLGEVRGILSVKVPEGKLSSFFNTTFLLLVIYDTLLLIGLFIFMQQLLKKFRHYNTKLEEVVDKQNEELHQNLVELDGYKIAIDNSALVSKTDLKGIITYVNDSFCKHMGYSRKELVGNNHNMIKSAEVDKSFFAKMWQKIENKKVWRGIIVNIKKDNGAVYHDTTITPIFDDNNNIKEYIAVRHDVTEVIQQRIEIKNLYSIDSLTQVPNRNKLLIDMKELQASQVVLFNIDGFKNINDFYGIEAGDKLLIQLANYINGEIEHNNLFKLYRLHSDEFAVLGDGTLGIDEFVVIMHSYQKKIEQHLFDVLLEQEVKISVTLGFAMGKNALIKADMALKLAQSSKNEYIIHDDSLQLEKHYEENIEKAKLIKYSIENRTIVPYFQPILNLKTEKISKYEALVRMIDGDNVIAPGGFLHIAKQSRTYFKVTEIMIEETLKQLKLHNSTLSINISMEDIANRDMVDFIVEKLKQCEDATRVVFEILESESVQDYELVRHFIHEIKSYGVKIAIDDFGSGYSNFLHVLELEADFLKIDGSLIKNIATDRQSLILVEGIVDFSNRLGMKTIAEFVENEEILDILKEIGVDFAQGYFIGKPSPLIV
ncbi:MAG: EAL domain-containing protein [Campylobacterota bacterium]|nr:EAL domain-containing protein [Campylobacterota bacterium]